MSAIQWTDHTVNPVIGCSKVSPGCANCYASDLAASMVRRRLPVARRYGEVLDPTGKRWSGQTLVAGADRLAGMRVPQRKRDGFMAGVGNAPPRMLWRPSRVFMGSMTDMFHETLTVDRLAPVWRWMAERSIGPALAGPIWQIVTKRPERARVLLPELQEIARRAGKVPRIHLLTSTEDQDTADRRIPDLLSCRPLVELCGLSMEPLLGPISLHSIPANLPTINGDPLVWDYFNALTGCAWDDQREEAGQRTHHRLGWVIVGGESGPQARSCHVDWIQGIVDQCVAAGVPVFVKQTGARTAGITGPQRDPKGGDPSEWPPSLRLREFPR